MNERDELVRIYVETLNEGHGMVSRTVQGNRAADAMLAAGWVKPRTISTVEELAELPKDSAIRTRLGSVFTKHHDAYRESDNWESRGAASIWPEDLPATVLHEGQV